MSEKEGLYKQLLQEFLEICNQRMQPGGGQFLGSSSRIDCPECYWPTEHKADCKFGSLIKKVKEAMKEEEKVSDSERKTLLDFIADQIYDEMQQERKEKV